MGLSVTMFGETKEERLARLLQAEEDKGHHHDDFNLTDGHNVVSYQSFFPIQAYQHIPQETQCPDLPSFKPTWCLMEISDLIFIYIYTHYFVAPTSTRRFEQLLFRDPHTLSVC